ncbi:MAG: bifunctional oligoribonuclease/PAP phosphatase NrnA, partial [Thermodesulfovibrionia bacterium]|nr:bifunctional oligoribonuclease/PAP phosphatase NrnA [Thermodesulfovibrionia bacterium]
LLITLDSSSWRMVTGDREISIPDIPLCVIDHHKTNSKYGTINLIDYKVQSVGEMMYLVFEDWGVKLNMDIATDLLTGIIGDTGAFRYPGSTETTFKIASELMAKGANKDKIIYHIFRSEPYELMKFYGEVLSRMKIDKKGRFVWSAISYDIYKKLGKPRSAKESSASLFAQTVEDTEFGFIAVETEKNKLAVSFRSRTGVDTLEIAVELGGGGHIYASACKIEGIPFEDAVKKVLKVVRKYAKKGKK